MKVMVIKIKPIEIKFISSKVINEDQVNHSKSDNIETMIQEKGDDIVKKILIHFWIDTKVDWQYKWEAVILSLIVLISCITNVAK